MTIAQLADDVVRLTGSSSTVTLMPLPDDDPKRRCPDITRAREVLGWQPTVDLEDGLRHTIDYFQNDLSRT
jgi:nucleoside-diphosphate-sugar epimerase